MLRSGRIALAPSLPVYTLPSAVSRASIDLENAKVASLELSALPPPPAGRAHLVCQPLKIRKHVRPGFHGHQGARLQEAAIDPAPGVHNGSRRRRACEEGAGGHAMKDKLQHSARNEEALLWS